MTKNTEKNKNADETNYTLTRKFNKTPAMDQ